MIATNKDHIEALERELGEIHEGMQRIELSFGSKMQKLEDTILRLSESLLPSQGSSGNQSHEGQSRSRKDSRDVDRSFVSKLTKLEFPKFFGNDPTVWINRVNQFCDFNDVADDQKVRLAAYHLEGEANLWWQWFKKAMSEEQREISWDLFEDEIRSRFSPTDAEDFDEALSKIKQVGSVKDYQKEFEQLGTRVRGWTQKALIGTFMGGLKIEIADGIRLFKPKTIKEAMNLARMKEEQSARQRRTN